MSVKHLFVVIIILFSCRNNEQEIVPKLPKAVMVDIIAEMELAQSIYKFQDIDKKIAVDSVIEKIYISHHTSKNEFDESLKQYAQIPNELDEIYNQVINKLNMKQVELQQQMK